LPSSSSGAARSFASRKSVQPCSHIHFWISGCNRSKAADGLDFEGGELISGFGCSQTIQRSRHLIGLHLDIADQRLPVGASVLVEHGEEIDKGGDGRARCTEISFSDPLEAMFHERRQAL